MERKQGFLFRCVDVVMELFAMAATVSRARAACATTRDPEAARAARARRPLLPHGAAARCAGSSATSGATRTRARTSVAASVMQGEHALAREGHPRHRPHAGGLQDALAAGAASGEFRESGRGRVVTPPLPGPRAQHAAHVVLPPSRLPTTNHQAEVSPAGNACRTASDVAGSTGTSRMSVRRMPGSCLGLSSSRSHCGSVVRLPT